MNNCTVEWKHLHSGIYENKLHNTKFFLMQVVFLNNYNDDEDDERTQQIHFLVEF